MMKSAYKKAYSIIRYLSNEFDFSDYAPRILERRHESELLNLPVIAVGAAYKSWLMEFYYTESYVPNKFLDIQTARKFRKKYKIVEVTYDDD